VAIRQIFPFPKRDRNIFPKQQFCAASIGNSNSMQIVDVNFAIAE
jgi:hypothetical protein